jgi:O-antigen/teichoic acid export membrane protein
MGLAFYIISYLGLAANGAFGLLLGIAAVAPAAAGLGLSYYLARYVAGRSPAEVAPVVRDRLRLTMIILFGATIVCIGIAIGLDRSIDGTVALGIVIVWLEVIGLDLFIVLIGLELTWMANLAIFFRSAAWVPVAVALGIALPALRSLEALLACWIAGHIAALGYIAWQLRGRSVLEAIVRAPATRWIAQHRRQSWYIWLSDLGIVGAMFVDRFIVNDRLGIAATGVFVFYWSLANASHTLVSTTVIQPALPRLVRFYRGGDYAIWRRELFVRIAAAATMSLVAAGAIAALAFGVIALSPEGRFPVAPVLFGLLLLSALVRACSDVVNAGMTSTGDNAVYAAVNIVGVALAAGLSYTALILIGLEGVGWAALATAAILFAVRAFRLRRVVRLGDRATQDAR